MKFFLLSLFFSLHALAAADCQYDMSLNNATIEVTDTDQVIQRDLFLTRDQQSPNGQCTKYRVFFGKGLSNSYQRKAFSIFGRSINYNLHRLVNMAGVLKDFGDALNTSEFVEGLAPSKETTYQNNFFVSVPGIAGQNYPKSEVYVDLVTVSLYAYYEKKNQYQFEDSSVLTVVYFVRDKILISLVDEGGPFDGSSTTKVLDFGILEQYQEKGVDLRVVSNTPYRVRLSSTNNGTLLGPNNAPISYGTKVNGTAVSLGSSNSSPVSIGTGDETDASGDRYNLRFQILTSTANKPSGLYQDQITITAIAN